MVQINMAAREIVLKVVYYGPALSGKTTNLQQLHAMLEPDSRGKMVTLDTKDDRTLYFDFLPIEFGTTSGFAVKLKLFTVPGQVMHRATRKVVLAGADAVAFIADSQRSSASANAYSYRDLEANLKSNGIQIDQIPQVVQFNKRDLDDIKPLEEVREAWKGTGIPTVPASAVRGEGVVETFKLLVQRLYQDLEKRHSFSSKFGVSEADFMHGVMQHFKKS
jgi:signal recognition particle receptor subunit beta